MFHSVVLHYDFISLYLRFISKQPERCHDGDKLLFAQLVLVTLPVALPFAQLFAAEGAKLVLGLEDLFTVRAHFHLLFLSNSGLMHASLRMISIPPPAIRVNTMRHIEGDFIPSLYLLKSWFIFAPYAVSTSKGGVPK